jgi:hypothetical protein
MSIKKLSAVALLGMMMVPSMVTTAHQASAASLQPKAQSSMVGAFQKSYVRYHVRFSEIPDQYKQSGQYELDGQSIPGSIVTSADKPAGNFTTNSVSNVPASYFNGGNVQVGQKVTYNNQQYKIASVNGGGSFWGSHEQKLEAAWRDDPRYPTYHEGGASWDTMFNSYITGLGMKLENGGTPQGNQVVSNLGYTIYVNTIDDFNNRIHNAQFTITPAEKAQSVDGKVYMNVTMGDSQPNSKNQFHYYRYIKVANGNGQAKTVNLENYTYQQTEPTYNYFNYVFVG